MRRWARLKHATPRGRPTERFRLAQQDGQGARGGAPPMVRSDVQHQKNSRGDDDRAGQAARRIARRSAYSAAFLEWFGEEASACTANRFRVIADTADRRDQAADRRRECITP